MALYIAIYERRYLKSFKSNFDSTTEQNSRPVEFRYKKKGFLKIQEILYLKHTVVLVTELSVNKQELSE